MSAAQQLLREQLAKVHRQIQQQEAEAAAAAVAGIGYRDLAAMGPESVMTEPEPCGYPGDLEPEAAR